MTTQDIANAFTQLCKDGKWDEAGKTYWHDDIKSIEAMDGPMANIQGRAAVEAKAAWWYDNHEVHGVTTQGPFVNGNQFALRFTMDVTPKGAQRMQMDEMALYTVQDGKVTEERFFY